MNKNDLAPNFSIRKAARAEAPDIFRVLVAGFNLVEDTDSWQSMKSHAFESPENYFVMRRGDETIGTAMITPHWLRVGTAKLLRGIVSEVAVLPELQGLGLGERLMRECVACMREQGFHLSRLGGLRRYYARFGYVPFPRRYYEFILETTKYGTVVVPPDTFVELSPEQERRVRLYHPRKDWQRCDELYDAFHENRSGSIIDDRDAVAPRSGEPDPTVLRYVYEEEDEIKGYLFATEHPEEIHLFEAKFSVGEVAFDLDKPEALTTLIRYALREALRRGAQRVTVRLPFWDFIQQLLTDATLPFSLVELCGGPTSNMVLLVDLQGLLNSIAPELSRRRLDASPCPPFAVRWRVGDQEAMLKVETSSVEVTREGHADTQLTCDSAAFCRWILGLNGFDEWQAGVTHTLTREQARVFAGLFPREPCASRPWG